MRGARAGVAVRPRWLALRVTASVGLALSIVLVALDHGLPMLASLSSLCSASSWMSCARVRESEWSRVFGVHLSIVGFVWHAAMLAFLLRPHAAGRSAVLDGQVLLWALGGACTVAYFVFGEWMVGALCPYCTLTHINLFVLARLAWLHVGGASGARGAWAARWRVMRAFAPYAACMAAALVGWRVLLVFAGPWLEAPVEPLLAV